MLSVDHVTAAVFSAKPALLQNLGIPEELLLIEPSAAVFTPKDGDMLLLCSDGLTDMVSDKRIESILAGTDPRRAADALLAEALSNGGRDNVTILLLTVEKSNFFKRIIEKLRRCK